ncbi:L-histidine N(alpha)-methyltransferase [Costertonia aggregata]|uniref:L-histidine N(Alpha)-methyltransferase n=1 Tax=Costertonia aggregata TaxID=343403 RepID=A0A7H9ALZ7_9FLAO|nr:L-histidine N(alpha)-methyltransferase [Costertonia aggregata]QLG44480.1 L-histidine N(alpha)-methyltransferase [Costertonia aggregata]
MQNTAYPTFTSEFEKDVYQGLTDFPKHLSSKYFYDKKGDKLFQDIMAMSEYYLTDCEFSILENHKDEISRLFSEDGTPFNLIELGAGDGKKTKILLKHLSDNAIDFKYLPIDISQNALSQLDASIKKELPKIDIKTMQGTYFETLERIHELNGTKKVILFLGSNIGNLLHPQAIDFLQSVQQLMHQDDLLFMGFDQKKNPQTILDAYNDTSGITEAFNKNVLARINTELEGDFNLNDFLHWEVYDPETGTAKSYLVSKKEQLVNIKKIALKVHFKAWETIHTEISQKYDDDVVAWLAKKSGLKIKTEFSDTQQQYKNYVFKKA